MESDVAVELLRQVEPQKRKLLIELLDEETRQVSPDAGIL